MRGNDPARRSVGVADDDDLGSVERRFRRGREQAVEVRYLAFDEFLVLAQQSTDLDRCKLLSKSHPCSD